MDYLIFCRLVFMVGNKAKGRISKRVFQESKSRQNFRKTNISYHLIRTRTCLFFRNFVVICFLETPALRFALWPYYGRVFHFDFHDFHIFLSKKGMLVLEYVNSNLLLGCFLVRLPINPNSSDNYPNYEYLVTTALSTRRKN